MATSPTKSSEQYTVVARRYRPQSFDSLVGQSHVVTALGNAIRQNRVGHAYLFTGARGVGKTSAARIFAKCLNCQSGPTPTPCNECDICRLVSTGEDVDVIEIDGASNRGIDEIRELRSNAGVRPSRARFKIYIIDEVHMLTREAFNALLKTLEEPPGHVKFVFCTTDPQKIPITVLSRCQRYDFVPVETANIAARLAEIAEAESIEAEPAALDLLARRAGGSMRDSQSLLEQLFSFCDGKLTVADVNSLLGTADLSTIIAIVGGMAEGNPAAAIGGVHAAIGSGADPGRFAQQLVTYVRDLMALSVGCDPAVLLQVLDPDMDSAGKLAQSMGLERLLATLQILDSAVVRMQSSPHARILLEAAVARAASLDGVQSIPDLLAAMANQPVPAASSKPKGQPATEGNVTSAESQPAKKKGLTAPDSRAPDKSAITTVSNDHSSPVRESGQANGSTTNRIGRLDAGQARQYWTQIISSLQTSGDMMADMISQFSQIESGEPDLVTVTMKREYECQLCNEAVRKKRLESALAEVAGQPLRLEFRFDKAQQTTTPPVQRLTRVQQMRMLEQNPLVRMVIEKFDAEITDFDQRRPK